jgi:hypothetical protein
VDTPDDTKICTKCGKTFPATTEFFFRNKRGRYGLRANCKECASEHPRQHPLEHGEVRSPANRRMSVRNAEERRQDHSDDQVNVLILDALLDIEKKLDVILKLQRESGPEGAGASE